MKLQLLVILASATTTCCIICCRIILEAIIWLSLLLISIFIHNIWRLIFFIFFFLSIWAFKKLSLLHSSVVIIISWNIWWTSFHTITFKQTLCGSLSIQVLLRIIYDILILLSINSIFICVLYVSLLIKWWLVIIGLVSNLKIRVWFVILSTSMGWRLLCILIILILEAIALS